MSKNKLTPKQEKELQKLTNAIVKEAKVVSKDYKDNPSDMSGSITQIHIDSPYLLEKEERLVTIGNKKWKIKPDVD
jgi:hypothetical protein